MIRECMICGKEFKPRGPQKTCGVGCRKEKDWMYRRRPDVMARKRESARKNRAMETLLLATKTITMAREIKEQRSKASA